MSNNDYLLKRKTVFLFLFNWVEIPLILVCKVFLPVHLGKLGLMDLKSFPPPVAHGAEIAPGEPHTFKGFRGCISWKRQ